MSAPGLNYINKPPRKQSRDRRLYVGIYRILVLPLTDPTLLLYLHDYCTITVFNFNWHTCSNRSNIVQLIRLIWLSILSPRQRSVLFFHVYGLGAFFPSTVALDTVKAHRVDHSKLLSVLAELSHSRIFIHTASLSLTCSQRISRADLDWFSHLKRPQLRGWWKWSGQAPQRTLLWGGNVQLVKVYFKEGGGR